MAFRVKREGWTPYAVGFGVRLTAALKVLGKSQDDVAAVAGIQTTSVSSWKATKGEKHPTVSQLVNLASALRVDPAWLAFDTGAMTANEKAILNELRSFESDQSGTVLKIIRALSMPRKRVQQLPAALPVAAVGREQQPINRRDEVNVFEITERRDEVPPVPMWLGLAAGEGNDLELSDDLIYIEELKNKKGIHSAVIKGDSMINTLVAGDIVLLQELNGGRLPLPRIESKEEKTPLIQWIRHSDIEDEDICVVSINGEPPTIKRIGYDTERGALNWKLQITADNPPAWRKAKPFQVAVGDDIVFHAKLIGRAEQKLKRG